MVSLSHSLVRSLSILDEDSSDCKAILVDNVLMWEEEHTRASFCLGFVLRVNDEVDVVLNM